jgi:hypothetical protein
VQEAQQLNKMLKDMSFDALEHQRNKLCNSYNPSKNLMRALKISQVVGSPLIRWQMSI